MRPDGTPDGALANVSTGARAGALGRAGAGDRALSSAGETTTLASSVSRRILKTRASTDASITSPSDSGLLPSGVAVTTVDVDVSVTRVVARAELVEAL